jgi:hypothetical protein
MSTSNFNRRSFFSTILGLISIYLFGKEEIKITGWGFKNNICPYDPNVKYNKLEWIPWGGKKITFYEKCQYNANDDKWYTKENIYRDTSKRWHTPPTGMKYIHLGNGICKWVPASQVIG